MKMSLKKTNADSPAPAPASAKAKTAPVNNLLHRDPESKYVLYRAELLGDWHGKSDKLVWNFGVKALIFAGPFYRKARKGSFVSVPINCGPGTRSFLPSWNIGLDEQTQGYRIFLRYRAGKAWSPWFYLGSGGISVPASPGKLVTESARWGKVHIDYLSTAKPADAFQYKIELDAGSAFGARGIADFKPTLGIRRFCVSYAVQKNAVFRRRPGKPPPNHDHIISVPFRSQMGVKNKALGRVICCPTSTAMMMEYHGIARPTMEVCERVHDPQHKIYGVWPRAAQAAHHYGLASRVMQFRSHQDVRKMLLKGQPIIASIRMEPGELRGARYPRSSGHLMVIIGFRAGGDYVVNDPYSPGPGGEEIDYRAEDIDKVWLDKGGVGIIIERGDRK